MGYGLTDGWDLLAPWFVSDREQIDLYEDHCSSLPDWKASAHIAHLAEGEAVAATGDGLDD